MPQTFVFVGLTSVGNELASNLLEAGYHAAPGIADADVVFTFTPFIEDVEEVYFGDGGMIGAAKEGAFLVNLGPASPSLTHEIYALAQVNAMHAIDAPLVVHDIAREHAYADVKNVTVFVGCDEVDYDPVAPMLEALSSNVVVCGSAGSGQLAKAAHTLQRAASVVGLVEADALCRVASGDEASITTMAHSLRAIGATTDAASFYAAIAQRSFTSSYTVEVMLGEVVAALSSADDVELMLPQAESAEYLLQLLLTIGGEGKGAAGLSLLYADEAECARNGLDWARAEQAFDSMVDPYGEYGYEDDEDDHGHHDHGHHHGHDHGHGHHHGGFDFYSPN